jgi:transposase
MASVEILAGPERRRRWSVEQKQAIVAAAFRSGAVVRDVARQADVTPSLVYRWRRDLRAAALPRCWCRRLMMASPHRLCRRSRSNSRAAPVCGSRLRYRRLWRRLSSRRWRDDDPGSERGSSVAGSRSDRHAQRHERAGAASAAGVGPRPACGRSLRLQGARGDLLEIVWQDGIGMSLYAKRLERGRFIWPSPADGVVAITAAQLAYMLDGIYWRNPVFIWRPEVAG